MTDKTEDTIRQYFDEPASLPTNFSYLVMQKINGRRMRQARQRGQFHSSLIALGLLVVTVPVMLILSAYFELPTFSLPFVKFDVVPAIVVLVTIFLFDSWLGASKGPASTRSDL